MYVPRAAKQKKTHRNSVDHNLYIISETSVQRADTPPNPTCHRLMVYLRGLVIEHKPNYTILSYMEHSNVCSIFRSGTNAVDDKHSSFPSAIHGNATRTHQSVETGNHLGDFDDPEEKKSPGRW